MMATTHAFVGAALASVTLLFAPGTAPAAMAAGFVGGIVPDLDVFFDHRRTLHFPVLGPAFAGVLVVVAAFVPTTVTVTLAAFVVSAAAHSVMDYFGGSKEARPWLRTTDHAVYDHARGRWLLARRWISYDGSPGDFVLGAVASVPVLALGDRRLRIATLAGLLIALVYTVFRKRIFDVWDEYVTRLPAPILAIIPRENPGSLGPDDSERDR